MRIIDCPYDVLLTICRHLERPRDRVSVARTNSQLHDAVLPHLYSFIYMDYRHVVRYKRTARQHLPLLLFRKNLSILDRVLASSHPSKSS